MTMSEYTIEQYAENYPPGIEHYFWNIARNAIIARALKRGRMDAWPLLDIGCGRGIVVEYLRSRGINCIGCPRPQPSARSRPRRHRHRRHPGRATRRDPWRLDLRRDRAFGRSSGVSASHRQPAARPQTGLADRARPPGAVVGMGSTLRAFSAIQSHPAPGNIDISRIYAVVGPIFFPHALSARFPAARRKNAVD